MNDDTTKQTKVGLRSDFPIGIASTARGSNIDGLAFNMTFIATRKPGLALDILKLWRQANQLQPDDPVAHDEDLAAAEAEWTRLLLRGYRDGKA